MAAGSTIHNEVSARADFGAALSLWQPPTGRDWASLWGGYCLDLAKLAVPLADLRGLEAEVSSADWPTPSTGR